MKNLVRTLLSGFIIMLVVQLVVSCKPSESENKTASDNIFVNQVLYGINGSKTALIKDYEGGFKVVTRKGKTKFKGKTSALSNWEYSGENYSIADFSPISTAGEYRLVLDNGEQSFIFKVGSYKEYSELCKGAIKSYYFLRSGFKIEPQYGDKWAREGGHFDTLVKIHPSATNSSLKPGSIVSSPGGWYDAGDYNKYIVNSSATIFTLLTAYDTYSDYFEGLNLNIPESTNTIPDLLDEVLYNLRWMQTMQDVDGGVYHKLTTEQFDGFVMPKEANKQRFMVMKTTPASLDFAASMAAASRIISQIEELKPLADSCVFAAKKAWDWALKNDNILYTQPEGMNTGTYGDTNISDEWMWASIEMFLATKESKYLNKATIFDLVLPFTTPSWGLVSTYGLTSIVLNPEAFDIDFYSQAKEYYLTVVDDLNTIYNESPAKVSLNYFNWGSNSDIANQSMLAFIAHQLTGEKKYLEMAVGDMDYILGRNPMTYCMVTGSGTKSPMHIHQRSSGADGVEDPIPGFLVGGPNLAVPNDCGEEVNRPSFPAISYEDSQCSYSTNEIAINWNAPLVYCLAALAEIEE